MFKHFHCEARRTRSAVEVQHVPSGHIPRSASSIRSFTQIRQKCSSIFNAKPTRPDQPLRFSMARFLTPCHPQGFIHQKLQQMPTKCSSIFNAKPTRPAQPLRFSMARFLTPCHPQRFIHQKLHQMPTKCSIIFSAKPLGPSPPLTFSMARFLTSCYPQRFIHQKLHQMPTKCSIIFNAKPLGPSPPLTFSMVHLTSEPFLPSPTVCPSNRSPTVTELPPGTWPGKSPSVVRKSYPLQRGNCHSYPPRPPNTH